jgi:hypothetical protein
MQEQDQTKLQSEVSRSEKARLGLSNPIFVEAIENLKKLSSQSLLNTGVNEQDAREKLWLAYQIVQKVEQHFIEIMETGKLAKKQLEDFRKSIDGQKF